MKRNLLILSFICMTLVLWAGIGIASDNDQDGPLTGTWTCESKGGSLGDLPFTLYLQQHGEDVDGSISSSMGDTPLSYGTFKQDTLEVHIEVPDGNYILTGKMDGQRLSGTWTYGKNDKGTWEGKKTWPGVK